MDKRKIRYYLWAWPMVFASAAFYTVIILVWLKQLIELEGSYLKGAGLVVYVILCFLGLRYYVPRMWENELNKGFNIQRTSVMASSVGIFIGASIGAALVIPNIDKIKYLSELPRWAALGVLFVAFACTVFVFSHYVWKPGRRR